MQCRQKYITDACGKVAATRLRSGKCPNYAGKLGAEISAAGSSGKRTGRRR